MKRTDLGPDGGNFLQPPSTVCSVVPLPPIYHCCETERSILPARLGSHMFSQEPPPLLSTICRALACLWSELVIAGEAGEGTPGSSFPKNSRSEPKRVISSKVIRRIGMVPWSHEIALPNTSTLFPPTGGSSACPPAGGPGSGDRAWVGGGSIGGGGVAIFSRPRRTDGCSVIGTQSKA